ncbi:MAG: hypothetical protein R3247_02635 [Rhodothermales bacterium]|nr:hypothetical protein [Rhodothermales bacterium]
MLLLLGGCDESVNPRLGIDRPFTVWGLFNPKTDTHAVRLFEIEGTIREVRPEPLDAVVTSTRLGDGAQRVWRDSVVTLRDGDVRHVYWAAFDARTGETYRLAVRRSDGAETSAEVTIPPPVTLELLPPDTTAVTEILLPVAVVGEAPQLPRVEVRYEVVSTPFGGDVSFHDVVVSYQSRAERVAGGWRIDIDLRDDFRTIFLDLTEKEVSTERIVLREMELTVHVGDEAWLSPVGDFEADVLVEPGVFSNVENGFGFVGAGFFEVIRWSPPAPLQDRAGFHVER